MWKEFIINWSREIAKQDFGEDLGDLRKIDDKNGFGNEGASEESIKSAELRLNCRFPNSFRNFLLATNGLLQPQKYMTATGGDYLSVEEIQWLKDYEPHWIEGYDLPDYPEVTDEEYFVYGKQQDDCAIRPYYLKNMLAISKDGDAGIYLLNPEIKDEHGEWEAWHLASWKPGADRFRSFLEMMESHYQEFMDQKDNGYFGF